MELTHQLTPMLRTLRLSGLVLDDFGLTGAELVVDGGLLAHTGLPPFRTAPLER